MSEGNVVSINKFKEVEIGNMSDEEVLTDMIKAVLAEGSETVVILGISENGEGMLAHTPLKSRLHTIGVIESLKYWLFINGLENGELD